MPNSLSKWFAALLSVLLLYFIPAGESARRQDDLSRIIVYQKTAAFVDSVRTKGYITPTMFLDFTKEIETTGNVFQVEMEHQHKRYHPEYGDPANPETFLDRFSVIYDSFYTSDIMNVLFPESEQPKDEPSRRYVMSAGDFFNIKVYSLNRTASSVFAEAFGVPQSGDRPDIWFPYGGMVLNEDY